MSRVYYGLDREYTRDLSKQPTRDTSSTGLAIEFSTLDGSGLTRLDVLEGLDRLREHIKQSWASNAVSSDYDL